MSTQMVRNPETGRFVRKANATPVAETPPEITPEPPHRQLDFSRVPWAQNMVMLPDDATEGATFGEVIQAAGLDWEVEFGEVRQETRVYYHKRFVHVDPYVDQRERLIEVSDPQTIKHLKETEPENLVEKIEWRPSNKARAVRRKDTLKSLGIVGFDYKIVQNWEGFRFADMLVDDGRGRWIAAGSMYDDSHVYGVMELNHTVMIGGVDAVGTFVLFHTSHNASTKVRIHVIPMRFTCDNMMNVATREALSTWGARHAGDGLKARLQNARETLDMTMKYMDDGFEREMNELLQVPVTNEKARWVLDRIVSQKRSKRDELIDGIMVAYHDTEINGYEGTGYGLLNGLTDYFDHRIARRTTKARFVQQIDGEGAKLRTALTRQLLHT